MAQRKQNYSSNNAVYTKADYVRRNTHSKADMARMYNSGQMKTQADLQKEKENELQKKWEALIEQLQLEEERLRQEEEARIFQQNAQIMQQDMERLRPFTYEPIRTTGPRTANSLKDYLSGQTAVDAQRKVNAAKKPVDLKSLPKSNLPSIANSPEKAAELIEKQEVQKYLDMIKSENEGTGYEGLRRQRQKTGGNGTQYFITVDEYKQLRKSNQQKAKTGILDYGMDPRYMTDKGLKEWTEKTQAKAEETYNAALKIQQDYAKSQPGSAWAQVMDFLEEKEGLKANRPADYDTYQNEYDADLYDSVHGKGAWERRWENDIQTDEDVDRLYEEMAAMWDKLTPEQISQFDNGEAMLNRSTAETRRKNSIARADDFFSHDYDPRVWAMDATQEEQREALYDRMMGEEGGYAQRISTMNKEDRDELNRRLDAVLTAANASYGDTWDEHARDYGNQLKVGDAYTELSQRGVKEQEHREAVETFSQQAEELKTQGYTPEYDESLIPEQGKWVEDEEDPEGMLHYEGPTWTEIEKAYYIINNPHEIGGYENFFSHTSKYMFLDDSPENNQVEQFNIFFKYDKANGTHKAEAFLEGLDNYLQTCLTEYQDMWAQSAAEDWRGVPLRVLSYPGKLLTGAAGTIGTIKAAFGDKNAQDVNSDYYAWDRAINTLRGTQNKNIDTALGGSGTAEFFLNVADSIADNLMAVGVGKTLAPDNLNRAMRFTQLIMSGSATSSRMSELLKNGMDPTEAALYAIGDGAIEWITEKYSLEQLLRPDIKDMLGDWKKITKFIAKNTAAEGSEEIASDLLNIALDSVLSSFYGNQTEIMQRFNDLVTGGMDPTEASRTALTEKIHEIGMSGLAGAISGGFMSGGRVALNSIGQKQIGQNVYKNKNLQKLLDVGLGMKEGTQSRQMAQELLDRKHAGQKPTNTQLGKLAQLMAMETNEEQASVIRETMTNTIRQELQDQGVKNPDHYAEVISRNLFEGNERLSKEDRSTLAQSSEAIDLWAKYNTISSERIQLETNNAKAIAGQQSIIDQISEATADRARATGVMANEINRSLKESKTMAEAIDNLQERRSGLISEKYAQLTKELLESDRQAKNSRTYLEDAVKVRMAAMTLSDVIPKTGLSSETAQKLFDAARKEFNEIDAQRIKRQTKVVPGQGVASFDGAKYGTDEWAKKLEGLTKEQQYQMKTLAEISVRMGNKLNIINDTEHTGVYGFEDETGTVTINVAGMNRNGMQHHMLVTMSHELTHWLEQNSAEGYKQLRSFVLSSLRSKGQNIEKLIIDTIDNQNAVLGAESGIELDINGAMAEIVAKSCENLLSSKAIEAELAKSNPELHGKIRNFVRKFVARLRTAVRGMTGSLSREARTLYEETEKIAEIWLSARKEALTPTKQFIQELEEAINNPVIRFSVNSPIEMRKDGLIAVHNISPDSFAKTMRLGGFVAPSIALTNEANNWTDYGTISVFFGRETVDPSMNETNNLFSGDAHTPTLNRYNEDHTDEYSDMTDAMQNIQEQPVTKKGRKTSDVLSTDFRKITNLEKARKLISKYNTQSSEQRTEQYEYVKEKAMNITSEIASRIEHSGIDISTSEFNRGVDQLLFEIAEKANEIENDKNKLFRKNAISKIANQAVNDLIHENGSEKSIALNSGTINRIIDYIDFTRNMSSEYMEAKAMRPVGFNQAVAYLLPANINKNIIEQMLKSGIDKSKIHYYDNSTDTYADESRIKAANSIKYNVPGVRFSTEENKIDAKKRSLPALADRQGPASTSETNNGSLASEEIISDYERHVNRKKSERSKADALDREYLQAIEEGNASKYLQMIRDKYDKTEGIYPFYAPERYAGEENIRITKEIKEGNIEAITKAAAKMAKFVPDNAVLIPMPGHTGVVTESTDTMLLAKELSRITGAQVINALEGNERESRFRSSNRNKITAEVMGIRQVKELPAGCIPMIIDNVVSKGETAKAAIDAIPGSSVLSFTKGTSENVTEGLKAAYPTKDKQGNWIPLSKKGDINNPNWRFSVEQLDSQYDQAIRDGDTARQQELVYAAGEKAGYTIKAYHGTGRADRVGTVFLPERATSGPMAYFTDNREIAENYARDKQDTSVAYDEEYGDYHTQFRVKDKKGKSIPVSQLWNTLSYRERNQILEKAKHITWDDEIENIIIDPEATSGNGGFQEWNLRENRGNAIETLIDAWLDGGDLYNQEERFLEVLELAGVKGVTWNNPDARVEKVYDTLLKIQKPFSTDTMFNNEFVDGLLEWWDEQDQDKYQKESAGADLWDKNNRTVEEWADMARDNVETGRTTVWTSIPDAVTDYLKSMGHDGIKDTGGKGGGEGHTVWIPFASEQVKSADPVTYDDAGNVIPLSERFNDEKNDIRWSVEQSPDMEVDRFMLGLNEFNMPTAQERTMLRQYKDLHGTIDVLRMKIRDREGMQRQLLKKQTEQGGKLSAYDREQMRKINVWLSNDRTRLDKVQAELVKVTSDKGYAKLMMKQDSLMKNLVRGVTADQLISLVEDMSRQLDDVNKAMQERAGKLEQLAQKNAVLKIRTQFNQNGLKRIAAKLKADMNSDLETKEIENRLALIALKMKEGKYDANTAEELTDLILGKMRGSYDSYVLSTLRGRKIGLSPAQLKELKAKDSGIRELNTELAGTGIRFVASAGTNLEHQWGEISNEITSLDPDTAPLEQVDELMRVIRRERNTIYAERFNNESVMQTSEAVLKAAAELVPEIVTDEKSLKLIRETLQFVQEISGQAAETAGEISDMTAVVDRLKKTGAAARSGANKLTGDINEAISYFNALSEQSEAAMWKKERILLIDQLKNEKTQELLAEQEKWKQKIEKDKNARQKMESNLQLRKKITTNVSRIRKLLINETDIRNVPEHMKSLARQMLGKIVENDIGGGRKISGIEKQDLLETKRVLDVMNSQDGEFTLDDLRLINDEEAQSMVAEALADLEEGIGFYNNRLGGDLLANLQGLHNALSRISDAVSTITSVISAERSVSFLDRRIDLADAAEDVRKDMANSRFKGNLIGRGSKAVKAVSSAVFYGNMTPVYFFKMLRNGGMNAVWQDMQKGENRSGLETQKARARLAELAEKTGYRNWNEEKHDVLLGGLKRKISIENMMELYAIWKREQTTNPEMSQHLTKGGIFIQEEEENTGRLRRENTQQRAIRVTDEEIQAMYGQMTDAQKEYLDGIVSYLSNEMSELGNEASMRMYGIKKYKESYYFPMKVWDGVKSARSDKGITGTDENRAAHRSWSKRRQHMAQNALVIGSFTKDAVNHIVEMINYNTMAPSIENVNKILNFQFTEGETEDDFTKRNLRIMFEEAYGKEALRYLETFMKDLNGGVTQDQRKTLRDRALTMFKKNAVAGSLSVALQQPLSYIRAAMMISPKYLTMGLSPAYWKGSYEEMLKHSGVAVIKDMGRFDMNFGQSAKDFITPETGKNAYETVSDFLTKAPELMDRMTWTRMWSAVKAEQKALHPDTDVSSDAFLDMVGERFNELMRTTQVYDSIMVKSSNMRSQNFGMKLITSFMAEPTLSLNVLADAVGKVRAGDKGSIGHMAKAGATFLLSAILQAAVKGLMGSGRTPDDKKTWLENFLNKFQYNLQNEANPISLIPGYSDLIEVLKTGELKDDAMGALGKLFSIVQTGQKAMQGNGKGAWRDLEDTVGQFTQLFTNIPAKNLSRDVRAIRNWILGDTYANRATSGNVIRYQAEANMFTADNLLGTLNAWLGEAGFITSNKAYYSRMYEAQKRGDKNTAEGIREYLTLGKGVKEESIQSGIRNLAKKDDDLTAEKRIRLVTENSTEKGSSDYIIQQLKDGEITDTQARKMIKEIYPDKSEDDIFWQVDRAKYQAETGKEKVSGNYYRLVDAVNNNKAAEIQKAVKDLLDHGITKEKIKDKLSDWKSEYLAADSRQRIRIRDALEKAYKAAGYTAADADKVINGWLKDSKKKTDKTDGGKTKTNQDTTGQWGRGNINLNKRQVVHNSDGSISTERSFSVNIDGKEVLLPTVIDGKIVSEEEAIRYYEKTGKHLGKFNTVKEAEEYAKKLHERQEWYYSNK